MTDRKNENVLAVDTSSRRLVLALSFGGDRLVKSDNVVEKSHGQVIMKKISELFESAELVPNDLDGLVVCLGPGSFTGLRIGLAAVKGIAVALDIPVAGISLFDIASHRLKDHTGRAVVVIPCRKGEVYAGTMVKGSIADQDIHVIPESDLPAHVGQDCLYGIGFDPKTVFSDFEVMSSVDELIYNGSDLIYIGRRKLIDGHYADLAGLEPMYLQKAIAEIRFDQRQD